VFNIGGIKYRLIVKVEYHFKTIYIRPPRPDPPDPPAALASRLRIGFSRD
jgi:hypothetical protein